MCAGSDGSSARGACVRPPADPSASLSGTFGESAGVGCGVGSVGAGSTSGGWLGAGSTSGGWLGDGSTCGGAVGAGSTCGGAVGAGSTSGGWLGDGSTCGGAVGAGSTSGGSVGSGAGSGGSAGGGSTVGGASGVSGREAWDSSHAEEASDGDAAPATSATWVRKNESPRIRAPPRRRSLAARRRDPRPFSTTSGVRRLTSDRSIDPRVIVMTDRAESSRDLAPDRVVRSARTRPQDALVRRASPDPGVRATLLGLTRSCRALYHYRYIGLTVAAIRVRDVTHRYGAILVVDYQPLPARSATRRQSRRQAARRAQRGR